MKYNRRWVDFDNDELELPPGAIVIEANNRSAWCLLPALDHPDPEPPKAHAYFVCLADPPLPDPAPELPTEQIVGRLKGKHLADGEIPCTICYYGEEIARMYEEVYHAQPTLGKGRLTRDDPRVKVVIAKAKPSWNGIDIYSQPQFDNLIDDLLALQPTKVSREQWAELDRHGDGTCVSLSIVRAWLKDIGLEVSND